MKAIKIKTFVQPTMETVIQPNIGKSLNVSDFFNSACSKIE